MLVFPTKHHTIKYQFHAFSRWCSSNLSEKSAIKRLSIL